MWYKVLGDANHNDVAPEKVSVSIGKADASAGGFGFVTAILLALTGLPEAE